MGWLRRLLERPSKSIISALDLRVVYAPKRDKLKSNGLTKGSNIAIVRPTAEQEEDQNTLLLLINGKSVRTPLNGKSVRTPRAQVALLACLYKELGRVVPYERLCLAIGHRSAQKTQHSLRQHMLLLRQMLAAYKLPYVLAVAQNVGYALCDKPRPATGRPAGAAPEQIRADA
jgi:DNA-binding response OmpR family regulator